jgi:hypothetical protein
VASSWAFERIVTPVTLRRGEARSIEVRLCNRSARFGSADVEVYLEHALPTIDPPERWMIGSRRVFADVDELITATIPLDWRGFVRGDGLPPEPGGFRLSAGFSADDLRLHAAVSIEG